MEIVVPEAGTLRCASRAQTRRVLARLTAEAPVEEVLAVETIERADGAPLDDAYLEQCRNSTLLALARGVRHRTVTTVASVQDARVREVYWHPIVSAGDDVRVTAETHPKLFLAVGRFAVLQDPSGECDAVVTKDELLMEVARQAFESIWASATPFRAADARDLLSRQVLGLLLDGESDATVAKRLYISERTVRRVVAAAMAEHGVRTRMQLGSLGRRLLEH